MRDAISLRITNYPCTDFPPLKSGPSNASIGPGDDGITSIKMDAPLTTDLIRGILKGELAIYVNAEVRYWDTFRRVERFTRYRGYYRGTGKLGFFPNKLLDMKHTTDGNDSN